MDDPSLLPFLNNNGNGHHYSIITDEDIEHEEDELDEEEEDQEYPEDDIDDDDDDEEEILLPLPEPPQQTIQSERGGRRKGVPRRLELSPRIIQSPTPQQRLIPLTLSKSSSSVHHHEQPILTSDQEEEDENGLELDLIDEYDENNNMNYAEEENIFEIVDDILADIVTIIVRDVRQQREKNFKQRISQTNGHTNQTKPKITNGKDLLATNR
jgi:hypothetical protein